MFHIQLDILGMIHSRHLLIVGSDDPTHDAPCNGTMYAWHSGTTATIPSKALPTYKMPLVHTQGLVIKRRCILTFLHDLYSFCGFGTAMDTYIISYSDDALSVTTCFTCA